MRFYLALLLMSTSAFSSEMLCLGAKSSKFQIIYLHGLDDPAIGSQEKQNRKMLEELATRKNWRIAVPRANALCKDKSCWAMNSLDQIKSSYKTIMDQVASCLDNKEFGIVGFSNGGYFATAIHRHCLSPQPKWVIASGSAGRPGAKCTPFHMLIGKKDITFSKANKLSQVTKDIGFHSFEGGHELSAASLEELVEKLAALKSK